MVVWQLHAYEAKIKGLTKLELIEDERQKYIEFINKILNVSDHHREITGSRICFGTLWFLHYCFPEKKIIPDYNKQDNEARRKSWKIILDLIDNQ